MTTIALTPEHYRQIIATLRIGFPATCGREALHANHRVAMALVLEANLGLRISDVLQLRLRDFVRDGTRYRLDLTEQKTGKERNFTVPTPVFVYIENYCLRYRISPGARILPISRRNVESILKKVCDHLGYERISTHSFRKFYATEIYEKNGCDIVLVQHLLQHSSAAITQRYIGIGPKRIENAILSHMHLP